MNTHKKFLRLFFSIVILLPAFGTLSSAENKAKLSYKDQIVIGDVVWPGYLGLYIAADKGYFKEAGLNVDVRDYTALAELSNDYVTGKMQGRANLGIDMVNEHLKGFDHRVVLAI